MANEVQHSPGGERDDTQRPASDSGDWRVAEGRKQAVLRAGLAAMSRVAKIETNKSPDPALETSIQKMVRALVAATQTSSEFQNAIKREIISLNNEYDRDLTRTTVPRQPDRSVYKVVESWIESGELIRQVRKVIDDERKKEKAIATRFKSAVSGLRNLASRGTHHSDAQDIPQSERFRTLLLMLEKELTGRHPALWCAAQEEPLRVTPAWFPKSGQEAADQRLGLAPLDPDERNYLEHLVTVTAEYRPVPAERGKSLPWPPAVFQEGRKRLVAEAGRLLGAECEAGSPTWPTSSTVQHWQPTEAPGNDARVTMIAPPLFVKDSEAQEGRRLLARGVIAFPDTAKLFDAMQAWRKGASRGDEPPMPGPIARAVERSGVGLSDWGRLVSPPTSKKPHEAGPLVEALLSYARLLTAVEWCLASAETPQSTAVDRSLTPLEQLCLAVMVRSKVRIRSAGESAIHRSIPWRNEGGTVEHAAPASLDLCIDDFKCALGTRSEIATCSTEIFAAVEDRDWRLWAIYTAKNMPDAWVSKQDRDMLDALLKKIEYVDEFGNYANKWENQKKKLLSADPDPKSIAGLVNEMVVDGLKLQGRLQRSQPSSTLVERLLEDTLQCRRAILGYLSAVDNEALGGLDPPRFSTGKVDVIRWRRVGGPGDNRAKWEVGWEKHESPFGTNIDERIEAGKIRLTFSASPQAADDDLRIFKSPFVSIAPADPVLPHFEPVVRFGRACVVDAVPAADGMPDIAAGLTRLRNEFAGPGRGAFDALIQSATDTKPNPVAVHWVKLLCEDSRFRFECHPPIEWTDDGKACHVKPVASDEMLEWKDSSIHGEGSEIRKCFAIDKANSIRVLSRGQPPEGSPASLAGELEAVCSRDLAALKEAAESVRRGIDVLRTFPSERQRWLGELIVAIARVLDGVVELAAVRAAAGADAAWVEDDPLLKALQTVSRIAESFGHRVTPAVSSLLAGATADAVPDSDQLVVAFHPTVPPGAVIVDRFGIEGESGRERVCRLSAGPAPDGFDRLRALVDGLTGEALRLEELRQGVANLPRHVLGEKGRLAIPSVYASVWHVLVEHATVAGEPTPWKEAVATLIRKPYDMVMFEPSKLGDYPAGWIVGPDGKPPRGRRISKVVRPGVQTLEKKLVWPAIVDTE